MYFKKALCGLISAGILAGASGSTVGAESMEDMFKRDLIQGGPLISEHVFQLKKFMQEETERLSLSGDCVFENSRLDSLIFGIFCCFCYKNNLTGYIETVVKQRTVFERREDMDVIKYILPENPVHSKELYKRFKIGEMSREELAELVRFIKQCVPKRKGEPRKPGRRIREEIQRGLRDHQNGDDVEYLKRI